MQTRDAAITTSAMARWDTVPTNLHILNEDETRSFRLPGANAKASRAYTPRFCTSTFSLQFFAFSLQPLHSIFYSHIQPSWPYFPFSHLPSAILLSAFSHSTFSLQPSTFSRQIYFQYSSFPTTYKKRHLLWPSFSPPGPYTLRALEDTRIPLSDTRVLQGS